MQKDENSQKHCRWTEQIYIDKKNNYKLDQEIIDYIYTYWRPNDDSSYMHVETNSILYNNLFPWFINKEYNNISVDIGCYIGVTPFGGPFQPSFLDDDDLKKLNKDNISEFLFYYDKIDHTKLTKQQLVK